MKINLYTNTIDHEVKVLENNNLNLSFSCKFSIFFDADYLNKIRIFNIDDKK